jgi:hypothetical protein
VQYNGEGGAVNVSWQPSPGPVAGYAVEKVYIPAVGQPSQTTDFSFDATVTSFSDSISNSPYDLAQFGPEVYGSYKILAHYPGGDSAWSDPVYLQSTFQSPDPTGSLLPVHLVAGPQGSAYLAASALPSDAVALRVSLIDSYAEEFHGDSSFDRVMDIPVSALTNGLYLLPDSLAIPPVDIYGYAWYKWWVQTINATNVPSAPTILAYANSAVPMYFDGSIQLKQNLGFLLRVNDSQGYSSALAPFKFQPAWSGTLTGYGSPTNYVYAGLYDLYEDSSISDANLNVFRPFGDNYFYRNFVFGSDDLNYFGWLDTGIGFDLDAGLTVDAPLKYQFTPPAAPASIPAVLSAAESQWIAYPYRTGWYEDLMNALGLFDDGQELSMTNGGRGYWGLPFLSVTLAQSDAEVQTLYPGGTSTNSAGLSGTAFYPETAQPTYLTADYYFCRPGADPVPGLSTFSPSNSTPMLIAPVGDTVRIAGYARMAIQNGYAGNYAYLGQYFDKAYVMDTNGTLTTNLAGVLSPYGDFFPTNPGPAAVQTMPDIDAGQQGTATVYSVKLQTDVDHNGKMDRSFGGPDNTSQARPYVHWVNNNFDRTHNVDCPLISGSCDLDEDDLQYAGAPGGYGTIVPDYMYGNIVPFVGIVPSIPCEKDLEDYARLWIPGLSNVMAVMPANYTVKLTLTGNGAIRLFRAVEPDGGTNYLFDLATASNQVAQSQSLYVGMLSATTPITLTNRSEHYIWCGVTNGDAQIDLQIFDGNTNLLADTAAYFKLVDIKQMYERWTLGDNPNLGPTNIAHCASEGVPFAFQYDRPTDTNTPYILLVHGWNMEQWQKDRFAETAFKRMYWQGYQGRFGLFRWPTYFDFPAESFSLQSFNVRNYDNSEYNAWLSAQGLLNKLNDLNAEYPGHVYMLAHSMGNVVAGEALRLAGTNRLVNTYVASQAAVPAHTYDNSIPDYSFIYGINWGPFTPNIYTNWFSSNSGAVGRRINFYNTNDYALQRPRWEFNQLTKTTTSLGGWTYGFNGYPHTGYPTSATNSYTAGVDDTPPWNWFYKESFFGTDVYLDIVNVLTNHYEVMAHAAQARSTALGRTAGVQNLSQTLDLQTIWPPDTQNLSSPYSAHKWHSAEFRSTNTEEWNYWNTLLYSVKGFNLPSP